MDIAHEPKATDALLTQFVCADCGMELPQPACIASGGLKVVEVGGGVGFVPDDGTPGSIPCTSPAAERYRYDEPINVEPVEAIPEDASQPGDIIKPAQPLSDIERMANAVGFETFKQMREMTKPAEG